MKICRECKRKKKDVEWRLDVNTYAVAVERLLCRRCDKKIHKEF
jgi:hypothetical protein